MVEVVEEDWGALWGSWVVRSAAGVCPLWGVAEEQPANATIRKGPAAQAMERDVIFASGDSCALWAPRPGRRAFRVPILGGARVRVKT